MEKICKNCINWKNKQRELEYSKVFGNCISGLTSDGEDNLKIKIIPHDVFTTVNQDLINQDGSIMHYRYEFCTHESFGCNQFEKE